MTRPAPLRVAIVDDEPIARRRVRRLLSVVPGVRVVAEAGDGATAMASVARDRPDLVLLDVEMPGPDGLAVARSLQSPRPLVVFLTAHEQYAIPAFDVHAIGYLLKPVSRERLLAALDHARERIALARLAGAEGKPGAEPAVRAGHLRRVPVRSGGRIELLDVHGIDWIESAGNYVVLHAGRATHILRETMAALEAALDPAAFVRVHRSSIVRLDAVARLEALGRGDYRVVLGDGTELALSRTHRSRLEQALGRRL